MYLSVLAGILGWSIAFRSLWLLLHLAGVACSFHAFVVFIEEPSLARQFGADYAAYRAAVRRWLPGRPFTPATAR